MTYATPQERKQAQIASTRKYEATAKRKLSKHNYVISPKGKAASRRYQSSAKGKATRQTWRTKTRINSGKWFD